MMSTRDLAGVSVIVAGAGLAGLAAARELEARGAAVTIVDARSRAGGRVWTLRDQFAGRQHAEAGADMIEAEQTHVLNLAKALGLETSPILRDHFGFYGTDGRGRRRIENMPSAFARMGTFLAPLVKDFKLAEQRWDSPVAAAIGRRSVQAWLEDIQAPAAVKARVRGLRGFFLADPEELSLLPLVEQFAEWEAPGQSRFFRIRGGNDRLATTLVRRLRGAVLLSTVVRKIAQHDDRVTVTIEGLGKPHTEITAEYLVCALPASTARGVLFEPALPEAQHDAITHLRYGCATRLLLQFDRRFWRRRGVGRQRAADRAGGDPELPRGRPCVTRAAGHRPQGRRARRRRSDRVARRALAPACLTARRLGPRSLGARRLRVFRSRVRSALACVARASRRPCRVRRRAHEHQVPGLHERRDRNRATRGRGDIGAASLVTPVTHVSHGDRRNRREEPLNSPRALRPFAQ